MLMKTKGIQSSDKKIIYESCGCLLLYFNHFVQKNIIEAIFLQLSHRKMGVVYKSPEITLIALYLL